MLGLKGYIILSFGLYNNKTMFLKLIGTHSVDWEPFSTAVFRRIKRREREVWHNIESYFSSAFFVNRNLCICRYLWVLSGARHSSTLQYPSAKMSQRYSGKSTEPFWNLCKYAELCCLNLQTQYLGSHSFSFKTIKQSVSISDALLSYLNFWNSFRKQVWLD